MKKFYKILLVLSMMVCLPVNAKLSCMDLDGLAERLDDLASNLESLESFGVNSELDVALNDLSTSLNAVANVENDTRLATWVQGLGIAWEDMEREDFEESLDDIIERLDELYDRDCE